MGKRCLEKLDMIRIVSPLFFLSIVGIGLSFAQNPNPTERPRKVAILQCGNCDLTERIDSIVTQAIISTMDRDSLILKRRVANGSNMKDINFNLQTYLTPESASGILNAMGLDAGYVVNAAEDRGELLLFMRRYDAVGDSVLMDTLSVSGTPPGINSTTIFTDIPPNPNVPSETTNGKEDGGFPEWLKWLGGGVVGGGIAWYITHQALKGEEDTVNPPALPK